jgi:methionyl-tRNA formyltransferase
MSAAENSQRHFPLRWSVLSDAGTWMNDIIAPWVEERRRAGDDVSWHHRAADLPGGEICFLLNVHELVPARIRQRYAISLVVHASALPEGKGWSPMTWQILEGRNRIPVTLLAAEDKVDSGRIYAQAWVELSGHELVDEWRQMQSVETVRLCSQFLEGYPDVLSSSRAQVGEESFWPRRSAKDSKLDPNASIAEQFDLLRVVDNDRYPAFFEFRGKTYILRIEKAAAEPASA